MPLTPKVKEAGYAENTFIFQIPYREVVSAGIGTCKQRLPRFLRAGPSTSLDDVGKIHPY